LLSFPSAVYQARVVAEVTKPTALKPTLGTIAPQLGYVSGDEKAQDQSRNQLAPWRAWYKTTRSATRRQTILLRDLYTLQYVRPHRRHRHGGRSHQAASGIRGAVLG
jgi:hypothetical protein